MPKAQRGGEWSNVGVLSPRQFVCGYCGFNVASVMGYKNHANTGQLYICPNCTGPSYFTASEQVPGVPPGNNVQHLPPAVEQLYTEARQCCSVNAYTASVLACRKLLMNIAVQQAAAPNQSFLAYVEYLSANGYVPPHGKGWVDHIRRKGNEATHEIALMKKEDADELISFSEMLLKFIFEFPAKVPGPVPPPAKP